MADIVIIRNKTTGAEERTDSETAKRLQESKYGHNFEFTPIIDPPEIGEPDTEGNENDTDGNSSN